MSRVAAVVVFALVGRVAGAAELPPGALARLGDDRFRAGGAVTHLALSPDGKQFATARAADRGAVAVAVWDARTGRPLHEHEVGSESFGGLAWGPGGPRVVVRAPEVGSDRPVAPAPADFAAWDLTDPKAPLARAGRNDPPGGAAEYADFQFSADGRRVAARWRSGDKHGVHVFDLKPGAKLDRVGTIDLGTEGADEVRLAADGQTLVAFRKLANANECVATAWTVATGRPARPVRAPAGARLMLTPDAGAVVVLVAEGEEWGFDLFEFATAKRRTLARWRSEKPPEDQGGFAFAPSGRELVVAAGGKTYVLDVVGGTELGRLEGHAGAAGAVAVSADGATIATADAFGLVRLWNAATFRPLGAVSGHRAPVEHAELSPDGKRLLTWAADETLRLWDVATGTELRAFAGAEGAGDRPTFAADGTAVLFRTKGRPVARDLLTGLEVPLPDGAKPQRRGALEARSARGRMSARPGSGGVQLIEAASGGVRRELSGHRGRAAVLGFTPDGTRLLTAGADHTVVVWDVRLSGVPLPDALKAETDAAKLWEALADGTAESAYLAMARLAREPAAAVKLVRMKLKPVADAEGETEGSKLTSARAIELLEAFDTPDAHKLLRELSGGHADAFRTKEAKRAVERGAGLGYNSKDK